MSYNSTTGYISESSNVTVPDMQRALGTSLTNVIGLCRHGNMVKYSRRKTYAFGGILPNGLYTKTGSDESIIKANNFGMVPGDITLPRDSSTGGGIDGDQDTSHCVKNWSQWRPPTGLTADEICRLGDMRGYSKFAKPHIASVEFFDSANKTLLTPSIQANGTLKVVVTFNKSIENGIFMTEFNNGSMGNLYLTLFGASYTPATKLGNSTVTAVWGAYVLVAQSTKTLFDFVSENQNSTAVSGTYKWELTMKCGDLPHFFQASEGKHFVAVGLAPKYNPLWKTEGTNANQSQPNIVGGNCVEILAERKMPFALTHLDAWRDIKNPLASVSGMRAATLDIEQYIVHCALRTGQPNAWSNANPTITAKWNTEKTGINIMLNDKFTIRTRIAKKEFGSAGNRYEDYVDPKYLKDGRLAVAYEFYIDDEATDEWGIDVGYVFVTRIGFNDPDRDPNNDQFDEERVLTIANSIPDSPTPNNTTNPSAPTIENTKNWSAMKDHPADTTNVKTNADMAFAIGDFAQKNMGHEEIEWKAFDSVNGIFFPCNYKKPRVRLERRYLLSYGTATNGLKVYWPLVMPLTDISEDAWMPNNAPIRKEYNNLVVSVS